MAFVGPSGAGKTTLVKLLVGLYRPGDGAHPLQRRRRATAIDLDRFRERIGFVTQDAQLFSGTIRENLLFVRPDATDEQCLDVLRRAAATSLLNRADKGLDTVIGEGGMKISGGEKQRLSIARALLRDPHLLVFDEATSSLDSLTEEEISRTMRDVAESADVITVLIAHRLSHRAARRPDLRARARPHRGAGPPRRAAGREGPVLRDVAAAGRRTPGGDRRAGSGVVSGLTTTPSSE